MGLDGKRVVVTRPPDRSEKLKALLEERGAEVLCVPTIAIEPPGSWSEVDDSIRKLAAGAFDWVAFTSGNAVEKFFARLGCMPDQVFGTTKVAAVGGATEEVLRAAGVKVDLVPESFTGVALARALGPGAGDILLPRAAEVPPDMTDELIAAGWRPHPVTAYRTVPAPLDGSDALRLKAGDFDAITFTSASTVRGFAAGLDPASVGLAAADAPERLVACIGPITARECESSGLRVDVVAAPHTAAGLVESLAMAT